MSEEEKCYYLYREKRFSPVHDLIEEHLTEIDKSELGLNNNRYLFHKDWDYEVYDIYYNYTRDYSSKVMEYSLLITGKFYKCKTNGNIYYKGGFSIC